VAAAHYQERESLDEILAAWRSETPVPDEARRQVAAELDDVGLRDTRARRPDGRMRGSRATGLTLDTGAIMTLSVARTVGAVCAEIGHDDVVDVHVALCARERHHAVVTSDPDDIADVDPTCR
jgi:hypothetical protein